MRHCWIKFRRHIWHNYEIYACPGCNGSGYGGELPDYPYTSRCPTCNGDGRIARIACHRCPTSRDYIRLTDLPRRVRMREYILADVLWMHDYSGGEWLSITPGDGSTEERIDAEFHPRRDEIVEDRPVRTIVRLLAPWDCIGLLIEGAPFEIFTAVPPIRLVGRGSVFCDSLDMEPRALCPCGSGLVGKACNRWPRLPRGV